MSIIDKSSFERCCDYYRIKIWEAGVQQFIDKAHTIKFGSLANFLTNFNEPNQVLFVYIHIDDWTEKWGKIEPVLKKRFDDQYLDTPTDRMRGEGIFRMIARHHSEEGIEVIYIIVCRLATKGKAHIYTVE